MSVRERAFHQVMAWLENDKEGDEPAPPEGLHPLAVEEWQAGATSAREDFDNSDAAWQDLEDLLVVCVKIGALSVVVGAVYWIHNPWALAVGSFTGIVLLWRWL